MFFDIDFILQHCSFRSLRFWLSSTSSEGYLLEDQPLTFSPFLFSVDDLQVGNLKAVFVQLSYCKLSIGLGILGTVLLFSHRFSTSFVSRFVSIWGPRMAPWWFHCSFRGDVQKRREQTAIGSWPLLASVSCLASVAPVACVTAVACGLCWQAASVPTVASAASAVFAALVASVASR